MAWNNQAQPRPQLPSIHNLNANYYPNYPPPMPPGMQQQDSSSRQAPPYSMPPGMSSSTENYGRHPQAPVPGSSTSENPGYSPITQTPPETGQPSPAATSGSGGQPANASQNAKGAAGGSEFVKKLFNMLDDGMHNHIVSWGAKGDSFIVKDMNEFTKSILPKHFKHSNFASFVRQLNKYDFHKVKNPESQGDGHNEQLWEFKHPNFRADMKASLEQIKRKGPAPRKATGAAAKQDNVTSHEGCERMLGMFQQQLDVFAQDQHNLRAHVANLTRDYHNLITEVHSYRQGATDQDSFIQNLISIVARQESRYSGGGDEDHHQQSISADVQNLVNSYNDSSRFQYNRMETMSQSRPSLVSGRLLSGNRVSREGSRPKEENMVSPTYFEVDQRQQQQQQNMMQSQQPHQHPQSLQSRQQPPHQNSPHQHQQYNQSQQHRGASPQPYPQHNMSQMQQDQMRNAPAPQVQRPQEPQQQQPQQNLQAPAQQRGKHNSPQWTVRPKVLLVEDDPISRKLSSKFLEVLGCSIEAAEDGVTAVHKMNSEKFDLVFMDINMPHLDGVSATSLIRQFDPMTPIISMTSNSNPNQILTYFSHGMNDILPKPFTKEGLLGMLEKHLLHLKQMQQLTEIPRALGIPDHAIESALVSTFNDPSANNPFADMVADFGMSEDPDYVNMLASLVNNPGTNANGTEQQHPQQQQQQQQGGGYRKREIDESEMEADGGAGQGGSKRGRYSDVM